MGGGDDGADDDDHMCVRSNSSIVVIQGWLIREGGAGVNSVTMATTVLVARTVIMDQQDTHAYTMYTICYFACGATRQLLPCY